MVVGLFRRDLAGARTYRPLVADRDGLLQRLDRRTAPDRAHDPDPRHDGDGDLHVDEATAAPGLDLQPVELVAAVDLIALGFGGLLVSRYLAAFQLGYIDSVWDPFFGFTGGAEPVLNSEMSHMWPVSDAGLGAVAYSFEFLVGYMGGRSLWRTMPWMVTIFGFLVIPHRWWSFPLAQVWSDRSSSNDCTTATTSSCSTSRAIRRRPPMSSSCAPTSPPTSRSTGHCSACAR